MEKHYDKPTNPGLGHIYNGDYYPDIPYGDYIPADQPIPAGLPVFDIRDYGALPEKDLLNTGAIAAAVRACGEAGGGVLLVAGGEYVTGTVRLPSNTTLYIAPDSALVASRDVEQVTYAANEAGSERGTESTSGSLLLIEDVHDIRVMGGGVIHGQGEWYVYEPRELPTAEAPAVVRNPRRDQKDIINTVPGTLRYMIRQRIRYSQNKYGEDKPDLKRPAALVWVMNCRNIDFGGVILRDSMSWTMHIDSCDNVHVHDMVIDDNRHVANADGIDVDGCADVLVEHCFISCSDDALVVKNPAHTRRPTERVTFRDCVAMTVANGFKIGTETRYDIRDILVEDCVFCMPDIYPGEVSGISLETCDGANLSDITVRRIRMEAAACPIYILLNRRNRYKAPYDDDPAKTAWWGGSIRNVLIEDIEAVNCENPCIISGYLDHRADSTPVRRPVEDITIRNFSMTYREAGEIIEVPEVIHEHLTDYPESNAHGDVPACGIWARRADGLRLENITVNPRSCNTREKIVLDDCR